MRVYLAFLFFAGASLALGDSVAGIPYRVLTGDKLIIKEGKVKHTILLEGIKAPVEGQLYYQTSLASLKKLVDKKVLKIEWDKRNDRCKADRCPKVGRVFESGKDISLEMVRLGMAWHDIRHLDDQTTPERTLYGEAEEQARARRYGIWKQKKPVPPWKFTVKPAEAKSH